MRKRKKIFSLKFYPCLCINASQLDLPAVFNNLMVQGKQTALEKMEEVVDILKKGASGSDRVQQLAAVLFITRLMEERGAQEKNYTRSESAETIR